MSEQENDTGAEELDAAAIMTGLKMRAAAMGIKHSNNITIETLRKKINDVLEGDGKADEGDAALDTPVPVTSQAVDEEVPAVKMQTPRQMMLASAMALVRCRITNMDPKKKELQGEILTVANEYIGVVRRFVPFGEVTDNGWHVPQCIYDMMSERRFIQVKTKKVRGRIEPTYTDAREFSLEILPPLTPDELKTLIASQAAEGVVE